MMFKTGMPKMNKAQGLYEQAENYSKEHLVTSINTSKKRLKTQQSTALKKRKKMRQNVAENQSGSLEGSEDLMSNGSTKRPHELQQTLKVYGVTPKTRYSSN